MSAAGTDSLLPAPPERSHRYRSHARLAVALLDQGVVSVATFLTGVLVSRATPEGFGLYTLVFTLWVLGTEAHNSLVSTPQMLRVPHLRPAATRRFNGSLLAHQFALSAAIVGALLVASIVLFAAGRLSDRAVLSSYALVTLLGAISLGPIALRNFARNTCFARRDAPAALALDLGVSVIQLGGVASLYVHGDLHRWWLAVLIVAVANLTSGALWLAMMRDRFAPRLWAALVHGRRNWRASRFIFLSSMLWVAGMFLYPWMILHFAGAAAAGVWGACFALANLGNPLVMGIQNVMGPAIAHAHADRDEPAFRAYVWRCALAFTAIVLPACVALALLAEFLLTRLNGGAYAGNGRVAAILAFTLLAQGVSFPTSRALFSLGRSRVDLLANVGPLVVMLTVGLAAVRQHGAVGAAWSLLLGVFVGCAIRVVAFLRTAGDQTSGIAALAREAA